ncbi:hypothetical protein EZS27_006651 [termite gut metagenome]|uniref:DUF4270 domain-containing protein n=1 Tax=termite gut metagenome TaxID=433724 RepID=A0A5J4SHT3_9ZZZZ
MKIKYLLLGGVVFFSVFGCDDNTGGLGLNMLPDGDKIVSESRVYGATTESVLSGPVYAKTSMGYLGKFTDPLFGTYEAEFMTQLNCTDDFRFPSVSTEENPKGIMAGDSIVSAEMVFLYDSYFGDSLNICSMSVYELERNLEKYHYTDVKPEAEGYYNPNKFIGRKAYTAVDLSVSKEADTYWQISVPLSKEFGERVYRLNREHPEYFKNAQSFIDNVFKGIYVRSENSDGTVLDIEKMQLNIRFRAHYKDSLGNNLKKNENGEDSLYYAATAFASTKEVIQVNHFENSPQLEEKAKETDWTYVKSPAGIFTQVTLPMQEIADDLERDTINSVKLVFTHYAQRSEDAFALNPPTALLLVREKEMKNFFEENKLTDNTTSYFSRRNTSTNQYVFSNIVRLVNACITEKAEAKKAAGGNWSKEKEEAWEKENKWNHVLLVPVKIYSESSASTGSETVISIHHDMSPGYAKLKGGNKDKLELEVVYSTFPYRK